MDDSTFMNRAVVLSRKGLGRTAPNPPVGAVIVKDGRIIGEGFHPKAGMPHAEIYAINSCTEDPAGSALYVTLEPCCHHGKTPPCTHAIIKAGIAKVVFALKDPNPVVSCKGMQALQEAGIEVIPGICEKEALEILKWYEKWMRTGMPYVTLKAAMTLDGYIAASGGDSKWISSEESRKNVHEMRNRMDAVMVGIGTAIADDPELTCRIEDGRDPLRIIIDKRLELPSTSKCLGEKCIIITASNPESRPDLLAKGARIFKATLNEDGRFNWPDVMNFFGSLNIHSILVEGGSLIISSLLKECIPDNIVLFIAPKILGAGIPLVSRDRTSAIAEAINLVIDTLQKSGTDIMVEAHIKG